MIEDTTDLNHFAYLTNSFDIQEPETYKKTMASDQVKKWAEALQQEMQSLMDHQIWELIPKQNVEPDTCPLKGKWVYKLKQRVNNQITWFKARWVVKDYFQQAVVDFDQIFVTVIKLIVFWALFAIAAFYNLNIKQIDIKTAFFYGIIDQPLYIKIP